MLRDEALEAEWTSLLEVRNSVNAALEVARQAKTIGNALSAQVTVSASSAAQLQLLEKYRADLPMLFITSAADVRQGAGDAADVEVRPAAGDKCARCWRYVSDLEADGPYAGLCSRCVDAVGAAVGTSG